MKDFGEIATAQYYTVLQKRAGLTNKEAANLFGVHIATIKRWRNGVSRPQKAAINILAKLIKECKK